MAFRAGVAGYSPVGVVFSVLCRVFFMAAKAQILTGKPCGCGPVRGKGDMARLTILPEKRRMAKGPQQPFDVRGMTAVAGCAVHVLCDMDEGDPFGIAAGRVAFLACPVRRRQQLKLFGRAVRVVTGRAFPVFKSIVDMSAAEMFFQ